MGECVAFAGDTRGTDYFFWTCSRRQEKLEKLGEGPRCCTIDGGLADRKNEHN